VRVDVIILLGWEITITKNTICLLKVMSAVINSSPPPRIVPMKLMLSMVTIGKVTMKEDLTQRHCLPFSTRHTTQTSDPTLASKVKIIPIG